MEENLAGVEKVLRMLIGLALLSAVAFSASGIALWIGVVISLTLILTGAVGICPAYMVLWFRTNNQPDES